MDKATMDAAIDAAKADVIARGDNRVVGFAWQTIRDRAIFIAGLRAGAEICGTVVHADRAGIAINDAADLLAKESEA